MGLRDQLRRLKREAQKDRVVLRLRGGGVRIFSDLEVFSEMFLCRTDLFMGKARPSEVLDAVRAATPESRAAGEPRRLRERVREHRDGEPHHRTRLSGRLGR